MASTTSTPLSLSSSSSTLIDGKVPPPPRQSAPKSSHSLTLPTLPPPPLHSHTRPRKTAAYCRKIGCSVVTMATGEAPAEVVATELPDIVKRVQEAWDKVDDKYAVTSLAVAGGLGLWVSTGMISAIERLPLIPGVLELVGIGYTGWFAYRNLIFKPDREALVQKIKVTFNDIIGSS